MEHDYLDIKPSQRIADIIKAKDPDLKKVRETLTEILAYTRVMEEENLAYYEKRKDQNGELDADNTYRFLRSQERVENIRLILQYMISFISHLPMENELETAEINPFEQFKHFALNAVQLLKEKDVTNAILKEHEKLGLLNETNNWYYRGQIDKSYKAIKAAFEDAQKAVLADYRKIFQGLQSLCTFWFSVRNQDIKRVRKSDIMLYQLTRIILAKYR